ncbi:MAG: VCBS repeat-containing protein [Thermoguttaceae bacterium]
MAADPIHFERHEIDAFPAGYQVAVADINGNGRPDVIALSTAADRVDWYENPGWQRRPIARTTRNIDLAPFDVDGDGRLEIALAAGFYFSDATRGGNIQWLGRREDENEPWNVHPIAVDPDGHRLRWGDLDGDGRAELVHAPIFGPGSDAARDPKPSHLWAFRIPADLDAAPSASPWDTWKIDETLTVLHGLHVGDLDGDGRDEILTGSFEGIHRFDFEGEGSTGTWRKVHISPGHQPADAKPGTARGTSEIVPGNLGPGRPMLAAIEPWHGHQVVVYLPDEQDGWQRQVLDETLDEGHALVVADFDGDGVDEIVAGWRGGQGGLVMYDPADDGSRFTKVVIEQGITIDGAVAADINLNGKLDIVAISGRSNRVVWYENR